MLPARLLLSALLILTSCCSLSCLPLCVSRCCRLVEDFPSRLRKLRENYSHIQDFYVSSTRTASPASVRSGSGGGGVMRWCAQRTNLASVLQEANDDLDMSLLDSSVEDSFTVSVFSLSFFLSVFRSAEVWESPFLQADTRLEAKWVRMKTKRTDTWSDCLLVSRHPIPPQTPFACQAMDSLLGFYLQEVLPTALDEVARETRNLQPHVESIQQIFNSLKSDVNACVSLPDTLGKPGREWHVIPLVRLAEFTVWPDAGVRLPSGPPT